MPQYEFECRRGHGRRLIERPMAEAGKPAYCPVCAEHNRDAQHQLNRRLSGLHPEPTAGQIRAAVTDVFDATIGRMRRIYSTVGIVMRPQGYGTLRPGDPDYSSMRAFNRLKELGELKDDATPAAGYSKGTLDYTLPDPELADPDPSAMRELTGYAEIFQRELSERPELMEKLG